MQNGATNNTDEARRWTDNRGCTYGAALPAKVSRPAAWASCTLQWCWRNIEHVNTKRNWPEWSGLPLHKVQYVLCRYTAAQLPRISAPWTASSPHFSTVDSARSLRTDWWCGGCAELLLPHTQNYLLPLLSLPVKHPPTPTSLNTFALVKDLQWFYDGWTDGWMSTQNDSTR